MYENAQLLPGFAPGDLEGVGYDGVLENSTLLSVSRNLHASHQAHRPDPGRDHIPEAVDGELVDENLNKFIRKKRAIAIYVCPPLQPTDGLWVHTEQWW